MRQDEGSVVWCVLCQDNNPGTRNLEPGHTNVKMKCAASRVFEEEFLMVGDELKDSELDSRIED